MPNVNSIRIQICILIAALILLSACTDPNVARQKTLDEAAAYQLLGENNEAIALLQPLLELTPKDSDLLQKIGSLYEANGDLLMASLHLEQAIRINPNNAELLYQTYRVQKAVGDPFVDTLQTLAKLTPEALSAENWLELGAGLAEKKQNQAALNAYLKALPGKAENIDPAIANTIGSLFRELDNKTLAEQWLTRAAQSDGPDALTALFSLLEIKLDAANWSAAEALTQELDKRFPGAIDASDWADARGELQNWRKAQTEMQSALENTPLKAKEVPPVPIKTTIEASSGKSISASEFDLIQSLANKPAIAAEETITYNPEILIQPADPDFDPMQIEIDPFIEAAEVAPIETGEMSTAINLEEFNPQDLLAEAEAATLQRDYKGVIRLYWQALGQDNSKPETWSRLSQTYTLSGQTRNAETTALEAIRLSPRKVDYTLDYLRIAQRSKQPRAFLAELETAHNRFPRNPEITLSLARAYSRINSDPVSAADLYQRFLELAPNHPLRAEAETAIANRP
jgi:tetratricopeptide (TPR) repeat protein